MQRLLLLLRKIYVLLLFAVLEAVALHYYAHSTSFTRARMLTASNRVVGGMYGAISGVGGYFRLRGDNRILLGRVAELENELARYRESAVFRELDSLGSDFESQYSYLTARVVKNDVTAQRNFVVLNKGSQHGVEPDMALLTPDGRMAGYVLSCSDRYSVCISVLNTSFRTSGKLVHDGHFGSIYWDGRDRRRMHMNELSKYADIHVGDTVVSTGYSYFFPPDVPIGVVERFEADEATSTYNVTLRLAADMSSLGDVLLVKNRDFYEMQNVGRGAEENQE